MPRCLSTTYILVGCIIESRFLMVILDVCWSHSTFHGHISIFASRILIFFFGQILILCRRSHHFKCFLLLSHRQRPIPRRPQANCCQSWATLESRRGRWQSPMDTRKGWGAWSLHNVSSNSAGLEGLSKQTNWWFVDLRWWNTDLAGIFRLLKNYITRVYHGILHGNIVCKWGKRRYVGTYSLGMYGFLSILP